MTAHYAINLCAKPLKLFQKVDRFLGCTLTTLGTIENTNLTRNFLNINNENVYIYAIKPSEKVQKAIIIRLFNLTNEPQKVKFDSQLNFSKIFETNSLEQSISKVNYANKEISFKPDELKTFLLNL
jgi:alpha-mannosidase